MMRTARVFLAGIALTWGWLASAAFIYLWGVGKLPLFRFPFHQWLIIAPYWRVSWWVTLWVIVAAAAPSLLLLVCGAGIVRHRLRRRQTQGRPIYGRTEWATRREMTDAQIVRGADVI